MEINGLDHLVMTVSDIANTLRFYKEILGMQEVTFSEGRKALLFGKQKINIHEKGRELKPAAAFPTPGAVDLCFLSKTPLDEIIKHLQQNNISIELGPVARTGATGGITSIYIRDPDRNLIEIANQIEDPKDIDEVSR